MASKKAPTPPPQRSDLDFPVVGIGASAGGLVAIGRLLEHLPAECGMALVIVLHLSPKHDSSADQVLQRATRMPVVQVRKTTPIQINHVYVISPSTTLTMDDGHLSVSAAEPTRGQHVAVDLFFRTLADAHGDRAMGVVLSGSGADGAVGLGRLKECGGVILAQAPEDSEYDAMPRNAIATGLVDFVLPVAEMGQKLMDLWQNARRIVLPRSADASALPSLEANEHALRGVLEVLAARTGHDFRHYKRATVLRRVERRMQVNTVGNLPAYRDFLQHNAEETAALLGDMLIGVTHFFRDREAFEGLERLVPSLFEERAIDDPIRAWVPACATGEEAYSIAMLLLDESIRHHAAPPFQIFASDIDQQAIATGRAGSYPEAIVADVPPGRLRDYFSKETDRYVVKKAVRDRLLFANHNVLRDPPFSRLDLISCRNLLIYLNREIQEQILEMFHFSLKPGGLLFLGVSESCDSLSNRFEPIDKKHRLYRARTPARGARTPPLLPLSVNTREFLPGAFPLPAQDGREISLAQIHQRIVEHYAPPSVLVDQDGNIVYTSEHATDYLRFGKGEPTYHLLSAVMPALRNELRSALFQSRQNRASVETRQVRIERRGTESFVAMAVRPFTDRESGLELVLVVFEEARKIGQGERAEESEGGDDTVLAHLERELDATRLSLQTTIEQFETSTEEHKASNEELQAINEELRSATEELETSKEELQSVNEELITVNFELKAKVDETAKVNDDLQNFIASTDIATVFLDEHLRIKRYTPRASQIFNIIPNDVGRSLLDITHSLAYPELADDAHTAFESLRVSEREVTSRDDGRFIARIAPYRTAENRISGAVLTLVDITTLRRAEERVRTGERQLRNLLLSTSDYALITLDSEGLVTGWNAGAQAAFGYAAGEMLGESLHRLYVPEDRAAGVPEQEMRDARNRGRAEDERWHLRKDGTRFYCSGVMTRLQTDGVPGYAKIARDATLRAQADESQRVALSRERSSLAQAKASSALKDEFLAVMSHELKHPLSLIAVNAEVLMRLPEVAQSERAARAVRTVRSAVRGQTKIIDDLLDLSRVRTGKLALNWDVVDLRGLAASVQEMSAADVASAQLQLELDIAGEPIEVSADPVRLDQVVWNLLNNAIKFSPPGGRITLRVSVDEGWGRLDISDTGQGIALDFLPHVFDMFGQANTRGPNQQSGLGIGLALVRQLIELHGGRVEAHSEGLGQGSRFSVWLPLIALEPASTDDVPQRADRPLQGVKLLIVDDSPEMVEAFGLLLELEGAEVRSATNGRDALALLQDAPVDMLLSDVGMEEMSGYELMAHVRKLPRLAQLPAIAITGYGRPSDVAAAMDAGFTAHLVKPVAFTSLIERIRRVLPRQPSAVE